MGLWPSSLGPGLPRVFMAYGARRCWDGERKGRSFRQLGLFFSNSGGRDFLFSSLLEAFSGPLLRRFRLPPSSLLISIQIPLLSENQRRAEDLQVGFSVARVGGFFHEESWRSKPAGRADQGVPQARPGAAASRAGRARTTPLEEAGPRSWKLARGAMTCRIKGHLKAIRSPKGP